MRLFAAVTPPPAIKDAIVERYMEIDRARWEKKANLHLTVRFFGDVGDEAASVLRAGLAELRRPAFALSLRGAGSFGRPARVLWLGVEPLGEISALAAAAEEVALRAGLEPEKREFSAHLTVARLKGCSPALVEKFVQRNAAFATAAFEIQTLDLYESVVSGSGAAYRVIESYPLEARS
jgi:2'-5' RNA ligase